MAIVKFADELWSSGGFQAKLDATGTYQPTDGNIVLFIILNRDFSAPIQPPDGWHEVGAFDTTIIYKTWDSATDSTTALINYTPDPTWDSQIYVGYEISDIPSYPLSIAAANQTSADLSGGLAPVTLNENPFIIDHPGCTVITAVAGQSIYIPSPTTPTETDGFAYDGITSADGSGIPAGSPSGIHGAVLSLSASNVTVGPTFAPTVTLTDSEWAISGLTFYLVALAPYTFTGDGEPVQDEQIVASSGQALVPSPPTPPGPPMPNPAPAWPTPLSKIIPAYPYQQYQDDPNIVAFFSAYNTIAQSYLDWFNQTPFGVYTSPHVNGQLLDWIGQGIYGIVRPVFSTLEKHYIVANIDGVPLDTIDIDGSSFFETGTAVTASDDYYKRVITWLTYLGDGRMTNANVIRKRVARFLYGVNGTDITASQAQNVSVAVVTSPSISYAITVPTTANPASTYFQDAFNSGTLSFPFQLSASVSIV